MTVSDREIGRRIVDRRQQLNLTQGELATQLQSSGVNWSQGTLSKVERGERPVRLTELPALAQVLKLSWPELVEARSVYSLITERLAKVDAESARKVFRLQNERERCARTGEGLALLHEAIRLGRRVRTPFDSESFVELVFGESLTIAEVIELLREFGATDAQLKAKLEHWQTMMGDEVIEERWLWDEFNETFAMNDEFDFLHRVFAEILETLVPEDFFGTESEPKAFEDRPLRLNVGESDV